MRLAAVAGSSSFLFAPVPVACVTVSAAAQRPHVGRRHRCGCSRVGCATIGRRGGLPRTWTDESQRRSPSEVPAKSQQAIGGYVCVCLMRVVRFDNRYRASATERANGDSLKQKILPVKISRQHLCDGNNSPVLECKTLSKLRYRRRRTNSEDIAKQAQGVQHRSACQLPLLYHSIQRREKLYTTYLPTSSWRPRTHLEPTRARAGAGGTRTRRSAPTTGVGRSFPGRPITK
jgi:hypothetical protein